MSLNLKNIKYRIDLSKIIREHSLISFICLFYSTISRAECVSEVFREIPRNMMISASRSISNSYIYKRHTASFVRLVVIFARYVTAM